MPTKYSSFHRARAYSNPSVIIHEEILFKSLPFHANFPNTNPSIIMPNLMFMGHINASLLIWSQKEAYYYVQRVALPVHRTYALG